MAVPLLTLIGWYAPGSRDEHTRYLYLPIVLLCGAIGCLWNPASKARTAPLALLLLAITVGSWTRTTWLQTHRWSRASATVERMLDEPPMPQLGAENMMVGDLPDSQGGASVFINGFRMAQILRGYPANIQVLQPDDWAELRLRADTSDRFRQNLWRWTQDGWSDR